MSEPVIITFEELAVLRGQLRRLRTAAGLLAELHKDDQSAALYREAGDLIAARYAVEVPCTICSTTVAVERPLDGPPTRVEAVACATCATLAADGGDGDTVIVVLS